MVYIGVQQLQITLLLWCNAGNYRCCDGTSMEKGCNSCLRSRVSSGVMWMRGKKKKTSQTARTAYCNGRASLEGVLGSRMTKCSSCRFSSDRAMSPDHSDAGSGFWVGIENLPGPPCSDELAGRPHLMFFSWVLPAGFSVSGLVGTRGPLQKSRKGQPCQTTAPWRYLTGLIPCWSPCQLKLPWVYLEQAAALANCRVADIFH